jgi:Tol biopolymer transport system component
MHSLPHKQAFSTLPFSLLLTTLCLAQTTERVSVDSLGAEGNDWSTSPSISSDGRYVAFTSYALNLVPGDTNVEWDIFVHDYLTGVTERVSVDSFGAQGDDGSGWPSISADGRYVAFASDAPNLVPGDTNFSADIFVRDRQSGVTERVSVDSLGVGGNGYSFWPSISADGRYVAFGSGANNLVPGDLNSRFDIFVHDRQTGVTERVSGTGGNESSYLPSLSGDGHYVAFYSHASNLVPGDTNGGADVFVHDRQTGVLERVSVDSLGAEGNGWSTDPSISADGRYVVFDSKSSNLVPGDTNFAADIFVHDRQAGVTERVSVTSLGAEGSGNSASPSISAGGRYVAFTSWTNSLVPGDMNYKSDIFVHDRQTGVTERVSVTSLGAEANDWSNDSSISADGRHVAFYSSASNLAPGDTNTTGDIFVHDRWNGLGANSIYLTGPNTSPVSVPVELSWQTTRGSSQYWIIYSINQNGSVIGGHSFDLGNPIILTSGTHATSGVGSFTSPPVPSGFLGSTIYLEVAARDGAGVLYDSNVHAVTFF